jgi:hypothetical protein
LLVATDYDGLGGRVSSSRARSGEQLVVEGKGLGVDQALLQDRVGRAVGRGLG